MYPTFHTIQHVAEKGCYRRIPLKGSCGEHSEYEFDPQTRTLKIHGTGIVRELWIFDCEFSNLDIPFDIHRLDDEDEYYISMYGIDAFCARFNEYNEDNFCTFSPHINKLIIDSGIIGIDHDAFYNCDIYNVMLPDSLRFIGKSAFENCDLNYINIPDSVVTIEEEAFSGNPNLKARFGTAIKFTPIKKNEQNEILYFNRFSFTSAGTWDSGCHYEFQDGVLTVTGNGRLDYNFPSNNTQVKHLIVGEGFTAIGEKAFLYCTNLESVTLPSTLFEIGSGAFKGCNSLKEVRTENLLTLRYGAFYGCPLESPLKIRCGDNCGFLLDSGKTLIVQGAGKAEPCPTLSNCQKLILQEGITEAVGSWWMEEVSLPKSLLKIHTGAFHFVKKITFASESITFEEEAISFSQHPEITVPDDCNNFYIPVHAVGGDLLFESPALLQSCGRCGETASYTFSDGCLTISGKGSVDTIGFLHHNDITEIYIEEGITQLVCIVDGPPVKLSNSACHYHPFGYCTNIKKLSLPSTLVFQEHDSFFKYLPPVDIIEVPLTCLLSGNAYRILRSAGIPRNKIRIARHRKK